MKLLPVPPEHLGVVWSHLSEELNSIAERSNGRLTVEDIARKLQPNAAGEFEMFAWVAVDEAGKLAAICLAEIEAHPRIKVCKIVACSGRDRAKWLPLLSQIEDWARSIGCTQMQVIARKGWAKELATYRLTHVVLEREL